MTPALIAAKRALRSSIQATLSKLSADAVKTQSQTCLNTLLALPEYALAQRLSVFLSMPGKEIDTAPIVEHSFKEGKHIYVPYIHRHAPGHPVSSLATSASAPPSLMDMLSLASLEDYKSLKPDSWGIPTLPKDGLADRKDALKEAESLDIILMPGVAFDESFNRLGHGKGYYDYFLTRYRQAKENGKMPVLVALAFKEQMVGDNQVPTDVSDWPVDIIVTGDGRCLRRLDVPKV